jgi:hypothetical protein
VPFSNSNVKAYATNVFVWAKCVVQNRTLQKVVLVVVAAILYYAYLASLYLVDEVHDVNSLRELDIAEKITIRVVAPRKLLALHNFVGKYSICPVVEEIQIVWGHTTDPPPALSSFTFTKTHSTVVFDELSPNIGWPLVHYASSLPVRTEAVMLMEADVSMACDDLKFTHSVWRGGRETLVGVLPRVHVKWPTAEKGSAAPAQYTYHGWERVWWNSAYSLMLTGAVMAHTELLQQTQKSEKLLRVLSQHPECYNVGLSMWMSSASRSPLSGPQDNPQVGANTTPQRAPMWARVPVSRLSSGYLGGGASAAASAHVDAEEKRRWERRSDHPRATTCQCLTMLAVALEISDIPYVRSKAIVARNKWFW